MCKSQKVGKNYTCTSLALLKINDNILWGSRIEYVLSIPKLS